MRSVILSCNTIRAEVDQVIEKTDFSGTVLYLESGLHNEPKRLHQVLQETLNRISNVDQVLLVMGYCGNAVLDLKPRGFRLIVPKADDCITMLLGSQEKRKIAQEEKYTYFFSKGWLDHFDDIESTIMQDLERMIQKYGKARAMRIFRSMFAHYQRIGVIDTGTFNLDEMMEKAKKQAELMQLVCEVIPGTISFLEAFLTGPWETDQFIIINSGDTLRHSHLFT